MVVWFEGDTDIDCTIEQVSRALDNPGALFTGVTSLMPGLTSAELVEQGGDSVIIETNEGVMKRTNISRRVEADSVVVEFDEEYAAGSKVTTTSHFREEFTTNAAGVSYHLVMTDVEAPGFLGFFYQKFGSSKIGNAFLAAYKAYLENQDE